MLTLKHARIRFISTSVDKWKSGKFNTKENLEREEGNGKENNETQTNNIDWNTIYLYIIFDIYL